MEGFYRLKPYNTAQKNVHYAQVFGHAFEKRLYNMFYCVTVIQVS